MNTGSPIKSISIMMSAQIKYAVIQSRDRRVFEEFYLKSLADITSSITAFDLEDSQIIVPTPYYF